MISTFDRLRKWNGYVLSWISRHDFTLAFSSAITKQSRSPLTFITRPSVAMLLRHLSVSFYSREKTSSNYVDIRSNNLFSSIAESFLFCLFYTVRRWKEQWSDRTVLSPDPWSVAMAEFTSNVCSNDHDHMFAFYVYTFPFPWSTLSLTLCLYYLSPSSSFFFEHRPGSLSEPDAPI